MAENPHIRTLLKDAQQAGVEFSACVACAKRLGVEDTLRELEIEVKPWGVPLTELIKSGAKLLTI